MFKKKKELLIFHFQFTQHIIYVTLGYTFCRFTTIFYISILLLIFLLIFHNRRVSKFLFCKTLNGFILKV